MDLPPSRFCWGFNGMAEGVRGGHVTLTLIGVPRAGCEKIVQVVDDVSDLHMLWRIHSIASASWVKRVGEERRPNGRHLLTNHLPCQWMPRRCQSSLRTYV